MVEGIARGVANQTNILSTISKEVENIAHVAQTSPSSVQQVVQVSQQLSQQMAGLHSVIDQFQLAEKDSVVVART